MELEAENWRLCSTTFVRGESSLFCILQKCMNNVFSCETVDGGCFAFAPLFGSNLFCQRTSQLGESACHMPISYRLIFFGNFRRRLARELLVNTYGRFISLLASFAKYTYNL